MSMPELKIVEPVITNKILLFGMAISILLIIISVLTIVFAIKRRKKKENYRFLFVIAILGFALTFFIPVREIKSQHPKNAIPNYVRVWLFGISDGERYMEILCKYLFYKNMER